MKKLIFLSLIIALASCGGKNKSSIPVSKNMTSFLDSLNGNWESVSRAFKKYEGVDSLFFCDMAGQDLVSPSVIGGEAKGTDSCYIVEASDKGFTYTYEMCWHDGKIISVKQTAKKGKKL